LWGLGGVLMWVFTKIGFFSAVKDFQNPNMLAIRARVKKDLENLQALGRERGVELGRIRVTPSKDYRFRIFMRRKTWGWFMSILSRQIDYPNFKDTVPKEEIERSMAYHRVWAAMMNLQEPVKDLFGLDKRHFPGIIIDAKRH